MRKPFYKINGTISDVIKERLQLQTVKRQLSNFGINDYRDINKSLAAQALKWDIQKLNKFVITLGGPINKEKTTKFLQELIKN